MTRRVEILVFIVMLCIRSINTVQMPKNECIVLANRNIIVPNSKYKLNIELNLHALHILKLEAVIPKHLFFIETIVTSLYGELVMARLWQAFKIKK